MTMMMMMGSVIVSMMVLLMVSVMGLLMASVIGLVIRLMMGSVPSKLECFTQNLNCLPMADPIAFKL